MENFLTVARQVAILFVLMGLGAAMHWGRVISAVGCKSLINVLILFVTPCLIIDSFQHRFDPTMLSGLMVAFGISALAYIVSILLAKAVVRNENEGTRKSLVMSAVFSNAGFMGIPLEQAILGNDGVFYGVTYVVMFNLFIWSWGVCFMGPKDGRSSVFKMLVNPGTIGLGIGLPLFFFSVRLPGVIAVPVHAMAEMNTPLAMIVIGYGLIGARISRVIRTGTVYVATFLRLLFCPLLMIAALYPFRGMLERNLMLAMVIAISAPVAAMVPMFASKFGHDVDTAVAVVSGTTILSVLTMPLVIALAMAVL